MLKHIECESMKQNDEAALTSEGVRNLLYETAALAHVAEFALCNQAELAQDEILTSATRILGKIRNELDGVAGGPTFDRLGDLEEKACAHEASQPPFPNCRSWCS